MLPKNLSGFQKVPKLFPSKQIYFSVDKGIVNPLKRTEFSAHPANPTSAFHFTSTAGAASRRKSVQFITRRNRHNNSLRRTQDASPRLSECTDSISAHRTFLWVSPIPTIRFLLLINLRAPPVNIDQTVSDFDGVTFHISTPETKSKILVSIQVKCYPELVRYGAQAVLEREYGPYVVAPESGYNFSVQVDLDNLPEDKGKAHILLPEHS